MTRLVRVLCLIAFVAAAQVGLAFGQEGNGGNGPQRVRVTAPSITADPVVGDLVANDGDAITIMESGANEIVVPVEAVARLEVRRRRGRKLLGAVIGLGAGAVIGGLIGRATEEDEDYSPTCRIEQRLVPTLDLSSVSTKAEFYGVIGGLVGAAVGAIAAALAPPQ